MSETAPTKLPRTGISLSDVASHFHAHHGDSYDVLQGAKIVKQSMQIGSVTDSQGDREGYGAFFIRYATDKALQNVANASAEAGRITAESTVVEAALKGLLELRYQDPRAYRDTRKELIQAAAAQRGVSRLIDTAFRVADLLEAEDMPAAAVAFDVVIAAGSAIEAGRLPVSNVGQTVLPVPLQDIA